MPWPRLGAAWATAAVAAVADAEGGGGHVVYAEQLRACRGLGDRVQRCAHVEPGGVSRDAGEVHTVEGELEPMLATEWNQVEPTTWEFTLREGVNFQDGTPDGCRGGGRAR